MIRALGALGALALAAAACGSADNGASNTGKPQSTFDADAGTGSDASDAASDAGTEEEGGDAGADADAAVIEIEAGTDAGPTDPPAVCAALTIGAGTVLPFSTNEDDWGLTVTPDSLSAAWITVDGIDVQIHYVDRADTTSAFGGEKIKHGSWAITRVALTPDGLGLAAVNDDGITFSYMDRDARGDNFGPPKEGPFANLNQQGLDALDPAGQTYADPVFARDGRYFSFSRVGDGSEPTVYVATRFFTTATDAFSFGSAFAEDTLAPSGSDRKIITSMSADLRTLFVWDQAMQKTRIVSLDTSFFVSAIADLGTMRDVQVSGDCTTLWWSEGGDLFRYAAP